jgi:hypothetical protein
VWHLHRFGLLNGEAVDSAKQAPIDIFIDVAYD